MELTQIQFLDSSELTLARNHLAILCDESVVYGIADFPVENGFMPVTEHMVSKTDVYEEQILGFVNITLTKAEDTNGKPTHVREVTFTPILSVSKTDVTTDVSGVISIAYFELFQPTMIEVTSGDEVPYAQLSHIPTRLADEFYTIAIQSSLNYWTKQPFADVGCEYLVPSIGISAAMCSKYRELGLDYFEVFNWWLNEALPVLTTKYVTVDTLVSTLNHEFELAKSNFPETAYPTDVFYKSGIIAMFGVIPEDEWKCSYSNALEQLWTDSDAITQSDREWFKTLKFNEPRDLKDLIRLQEIGTAYSQ